MNRLLALLLALLVCAVSARTQTASVPSPPPPDERFKADVLLIVAHPDDETAIGSYLAKLVYDDNKRVAVIYCNRGTGGGNTHGVEQSYAMGAIREVEVRRALASFGIFNVWVLEGKDTPGQDVFQSLSNWHHGAILEQVVRLVRLTRADVILTWLPEFSTGENHGDHQASGVIATEAFDMSGDPTVFPTQVAFPRERIDINNFNEGLTTWQPKKIYYFSDRAAPVNSVGPAFDISGISRTKKVPYYQLAAGLSTPHLTQGDVAQEAIDAIRSGKYDKFRSSMERFRLLFGKSVVKAAPTGDVFQGVTPEAVSYTPPPGYTPIPHTGVLAELGGVFTYYRDFRRTHGLEHLNGLVPPEIAVAAGSYLHIPLLLRNDTRDSVTITLSPVAPTGWSAVGGGGRYTLAPNSVQPAQTFFRAPGEPGKPVDVGWEATVNGKTVGRCTMAVTLEEWTLPQ